MAVGALQFVSPKQIATLTLLSVMIVSGHAHAAGKQKMYQERGEHGPVAVEVVNGEVKSTTEANAEEGLGSKALNIAKSGATTVCGNGVGKTALKFVAGMFTMGVGSDLVGKGCDAVEAQNKVSAEKVAQAPEASKTPTAPAVGKLQKVSGKKASAQQEVVPVKPPVAPVTPEVDNTKEEESSFGFGGIGRALSGLKDKIQTRTADKESVQPQNKSESGLNF